ncbi:MAG: ATP-binding protein [Bdellovibrionia bacterium]
MILKSLVHDKNELVPVEIEIAFLPGLPQVQFLGLPDQLIKESIFRLKSAFQACGYEFPKTHQIIVNIKPTHFRKSSRGLELAVALGILLKTNQILLPSEIRKKIIYGELSLDGQLSVPEDLFQVGRWKLQGHSVVTGKMDLAETDFHFYSLSHLKELTFHEGPERLLEQAISRPLEYLGPSFSFEQSRILELAALGGHNLFVAGPAGIGKTTMAKALWALASSPSKEKILEARLRCQDLQLHWRPLIAPHHTVTPMAMTGGGQKIFYGEITRAHHGVLLLDEFLEFHPRVQESLREPMEEGKLRIARGGNWEVFPAQTQVIATSNLCPCGKWVPNGQVLCRRTLSKCQSYRERLSGPVLDRFQIFKIFKKAPLQESGRSALDILNKVEAVRSQVVEVPLQTSRLSDQELKRFEAERGRSSFLALENLNPRRALQVRRLALTIATLEGKSAVQCAHIEEARVWALDDFEKLN